MEIHKPKAAHSWREFAVEIGTIICGILIALSLEQGVEWLHWRHALHIAEEGYRKDAKVFVAQAGEREALWPCQTRELDRLSLVLAKATESRRLTGAGRIVPPPAQTWSDSTYDALLSGQVLPHMGVEQRRRLSALHDTLISLKRSRDVERRAWSQLSVLEGPERAIGETELAAMRLAVADARSEGLTTRRLAGVLLRWVRAWDILEADDAARAEKAGFDFAATRFTCTPQDKPVEDYQGLSGNLPSFFQDLTPAKER